MNTRFSEEDEVFRGEIAGWLAENLIGEFAGLRGRGGPGDDHALIDERKAWERRLGEAGWIGIGLPASMGGRDLPLMRGRSSCKRMVPTLGKLPATGSSPSRHPYTGHGPQ